MNTKGLVSIITPCYNGEKYVHRLLDSILIQDYPLIEMFVIDDGSTDKTKNIIESYIPQFNNKGYDLTYVYQENAGQAAALNKGLKLITGEYLIWPDSDDYYCTEKAITTFVETFRNLDNSYGMVRCQGYNVDEETLDVISERNHHIHSEQLFEAYFYGKENIGGPGLLMIRMVAFDNVVKNRNIYVKRHPQNMQMVFPITYSYKTYTTKERLHNILCRKESHSHKKKSYKEQIEDINGFEAIRDNTIYNMIIPLSEKEYWLKCSKKIILSEKIICSINNNQKRDAKIFTKKLYNIGGNIPLKRRIKIEILPLINKLKTWS